ncbi:MAG: hypothetical protein JNL38_09915 [Myxococcales bacterium]|nr:hypothetical protein [Myxococcales bacterium]
MRVLRFQIRHPSGQVDQINVEGERVVIGSGAHCEIRLPIDQARVEHVLIELAPAGVFARALSFEPAPTINNIPFTQAPLPPESVLGVNQMQIYVMVADGAAGGLSVQQQKKKTSPITLIAVVLMLPAGLYVLFSDDDKGPTAKMPKEPPDLWGAPVAACPQAGAAALTLGREKMIIADAKRERRPFHVQDGVQAVPLYELSGACFRAGGDQATAQYADDTARFLRQEINNDYRTQRVRLEHDISVEDWQGAQKCVRLLQQYTEGKTGDYVTWLAQVDRKLKVKAANQK